MADGGKARVVSWRPSLGTAGPVAFGVFSALCIVGFAPPPIAYNNHIGDYMLAVGAILIAVAYRHGERIDIDALDRWWRVALCGSIVISVAAGPAPFAAIERLQLYAGVVALGVAIYLVHRRSAEHPLQGYLWAILLVHALLVAAILAWFLAGQVQQPWNGRTPFHSNIRHFAYHGYLAAASGVAIFALSKRLHAQAVALTTVALFAIIAFGARGALIAWLVCALVTTTLSSGRRRVLGLCLASLIGGVLMAWAAQVAQLMPGASSLFDRAGEGAAMIYGSAGRWPIWQKSWQAIAAQPLWGYGPEGYAFSNCCNPRTVQPHNFVLQMLMEFGLVGATVLVALAMRIAAGFGTLQQWTGAVRQSPELRCIAAVLTGFCVYAFVDGLLYHAVPLMHFAVFVGLAFAAMRSHVVPAVRQ